jgi:excisionase family DNA binding protein
MKPLLTLDEVAELLGIPASTLYRWRSEGDGPPSFRVGRVVRYDSADLEAWLQRQKRRTLAGDCTCEADGYCSACSDLPSVQRERKSRFPAA